MPARDYLSFYATRFDSVELNGVFYRLPTPAALQSWYAATPSRFRFAYKGSRFITHMKKLSDPAKALKVMYSRTVCLREKVSMILWQLPPFWKVPTDRLAAFLKALSKDYRYAMEFRRDDSYTPENLELLRRYGVALCWHDMGLRPTPQVRTAPHLYVRFHGTEKRRYHGSYQARQLRQWHARLKKERGPIDIYFNNDWEAHAPRNAEALRSLFKVRS